MPTEKTYPGLVITHHRVVDAASKLKAQGSFYGWQNVSLTPRQWIDHLEQGHTISSGEFTPKDDGKYSHKEEYSAGTYFIWADGDSFRGIEFNDKGEDVNPDGLEVWTERNGLSERFPELPEYAYAIGESVSSMSEEKPHRRYRICFLFDEPITCGIHYRQILSTLAETFPIITTVKRQPGQPVFGNARDKENDFYVYGNILKLSDFPFIDPEQPEPTPTPKSPVDGHGKYNATQRKYRNDLDGLTRDANLTCHETSADGTVRVDCPFNAEHKRDAFVKLDSDGYPSFKCHHNSCSGKGFNEMAKVTGIEVPYNPRGEFDAKQAELANQYQQNQQAIRDAEDGQTYTDEQIDTDITDREVPDFPMELFTGIFSHYREALDEANPVPDSFLFATMKQAICATLGRSVFIDTEPLVYPVIFTGLIGDSSTGHKGVALKCIRRLLRIADPNVLQMPSLTTEEGFIDMFIEPEPVIKKFDEEGNEVNEITGYTGGWFPFVNDKDKAEEIMEAQMSAESIRILGTFDEFSQILQRGKKAYTAGMLEMIMDLYDAPDQIISPNKHSKSSADNPTFGLIGCSTFNLIENALDTNYIGGGLTNRFEWFHGESKRSMFTFGKAKVDAWTKAVEQLQALRARFDSPTAYTMTPESNDMGLQWLKQFEKQLGDIDHDFVVDSLKRQKILIMKNALIFSILRNEGTDIEPVDIEKAIILSEYTCNIVNILFANFHNSETKRVVSRIIEILKEKPRLSKKRIWQYMKWAEVRDVEDSIDRLTRMGILGVEKPKRTPLYLVIKENYE